MNKYHPAHPHYLGDTDGCSQKEFVMQVEGEFVNEKEASHEDLCDKALENYKTISDEACHYNSLIPKAIEFYKQHGGDQRYRR